MEIKQIQDKTIWEKFIERHAGQSLFQSWSWGEVQKKIPIPIWRLGIYEKDTLVGIAQVLKIRARRGSYLHLRHGPIFTQWRKEYFSCLLDYLKLLGRSEKIVFIRISPLVENSKEHIAFFKSFGFFDAPIHQMDGEYCWVLDIDKSEQELLLGMRKTTRYLIRQAEKLGVTIIKSTDVSDLDEFMQLYVKTAKRHQFVAHKGIGEEFVEFAKNRNVLLLKGYYGKKLLSAALIIFYNQQAIYHHSASLESRVGVNYLLQWEAIKEAKKRGKMIYNFWGVAPVVALRHPWRGLSLFKRGFGGRTIEYLHAKDLPLSFQYCATYTFEILRRLWKGY